MKKRLFSCLLIFTLLFNCTAYAADVENLTAQWTADYNQMKLIVTVNSPVKYNQRITAVMYPYGAAQSMDNYSRVNEITVTPGQSGIVEFKLGNDLNAAQGKYAVDIAGNGVGAAQSKASLIVYLLTPENSAAYLAALNSAQSAEPNGDTAIAVKMVADFLKLSMETDEEVLKSHLSAFLSARRDDYNGSFSSLNDAAIAWNFAEIAVYLMGDSVSPTVLRAMAEANADAIDLDVTDSDYLLYADKVYADLCRVRMTYGGSGLKSAASIKEALAKFTAVEAINAADMDNMQAVVEKYYFVLGITDAQMTKFGGYTVSDKSKVLRQLYAKAYTDPNAVVTDFNAAMAQNFNTNTTGGSTGGGGGGKSAGGGVSLAPSVNPLPEIKTDFSDCNAGHWAYEYVQTLRSANIIDGYDDGTFRPDDAVTREEFVKLIISAAGLYSAEAQCEFADVPSEQWYYSFVASALKAGLVSGVSDDKFGVGQPITREDAAVISARLLGEKSAVASALDNKFTDSEQISDYAVQSVALLSSLGIINGFEDGSFAPQSGLTRAQTAKIIAMIRDQI